jgi:uncharacterized membrane protein
MGTTEGGLIALCGGLIELLAAFVVAYHAARALLSLAKDRQGDQARLLIARGVLDALSFSVAGTLLKTIGLQNWTQIRMFAFVLILRTVLKRIFQWENVAILRRQKGEPFKSDS